MSDSKFTYERDGAVAILTVDDGKANAIQGEFLRELNSLLDRALEENVGALVITGRPGFFSAGLDLKTLPALDPKQKREDLLLFGEVMMRLFTFERPIIAAIGGHAIAGGAVLALAADLRIAAEGEYKIGLNEVPISLPLPMYVVDMALATLPATSYTEAILHGVLYEPYDALEVGWVDDVVPADSLMDAAMGQAKAVSGLPGEAYRITKDRLRGRMIERSSKEMVADLDGFMSVMGEVG